MLQHSWHMIKELNPTISEDCRQQNATDFTCDEINKLEYAYPDCPAILKTKTRHNVERTPLLLTDRYDTELGYAEGWFLGPGFYETVSAVKVQIPSDKAGWVIQRSSLNRNGVMVMGSLYDSGFRGTINSTIYVFNPAGIFIEKGARIGQFVLADAEALSQYDGQYQS